LVNNAAVFPHAICVGVAFSVRETIRPMIEIAPLEQAADAYAHMMQAKHAPHGAGHSVVDE
jgi:hypothetical protein